MKRRLPQRRIERIATGVVIVLMAIAPIAARGTEPTPITVVAEAEFRPFIVLPTPTPLPIIYEPDRRPVPTRPAVSVPTPPVHVVEAPAAVSGARSLRGKASWYCKAGVSACHYQYPPGSMVAAACGKLRAAMGSNWRGKTVTVVRGSRSVRVKLVDYCASTTKTIDLYWEPMRQLGGTGVLDVTISW